MSNEKLSPWMTDELRRRFGSLAAAMVDGQIRSTDDYWRDFNARVTANVNRKLDFLTRAGYFAGALELKEITAQGE